jgi:BlaI family transcriptional regulator, penicillinase repressor
MQGRKNSLTTYYKSSRFNLTCSKTNNGKKKVTQKKQIKLTKFEMEMMDALWQLGSGSVREIQEQLPLKKRPAYTTVQTIIRRLEEKGAVRRIKKIGNAFIFEPIITRQSAHHRLINELLELFGGSARPLMAHLAETGKLSLEDIREMETLVSEQDSQGKSSGQTSDHSGKRK